MDRIWKWRWATTGILISISVLIMYLFLDTPLSAYLIISCIGGDVGIIIKFLIIPKHKEIEERDKKRNKEESRLNPVKKLIELLENYNEIRFDHTSEPAKASEICELLRMLGLIGFSVSDNLNDVKDNNFRVHLTRTVQFLISKLLHGREFQTDFIIEYKSGQYYKNRPYALNNEDVPVLKEFIKHLKARL